MDKKARSEQMSEATNAGESVRKKPYVAPTLRRLGSVRDLTLSGGTTVVDGSRSKRHM